MNEFEVTKIQRHVNEMPHFFQDKETSKIYFGNLIGEKNNVMMIRIYVGSKFLEAPLSSFQIVHHKIITQQKYIVIHYREKNMDYICDEIENRFNELSDHGWKYKENLGNNTFLFEKEVTKIRVLTNNKIESFNKEITIQNSEL